MPDDLKETENLMGVLLLMKPKQHDEMKVGKAKAKKVRSPANKLASFKPKTV